MVHNNQRTRLSTDAGCAREYRERIRVLFLVDDLTHDGGIKTRVTEELNCLDPDDIEMYVVSRCVARNLFAVPKMTRSLSSGSESLHVPGFAYPKMPHGGLSVLAEFSVLLNLAFSLAVLLPVAICKRVSVIYAHNLECGLSGVLLSKLLGIRCIVDLHGVEVDEYFARYTRWRRAGRREGFWRAIEGAVIRNADRVVCVSSKHKDVLESQKPVAGTLFVIPCFADETVFRYQAEDRVDVRKRLSVNDDEILFVHSGIFHKSADGNDPMSLFSKLPGHERGRLLAIVPDSDAERMARRLAERKLENRVTIIQCPRKDVPKYLSASDVAILVRKNVLVNNVASPTKFAEYLLCGLPVLISENVGDASALIEENRLGIVIGGDWNLHPELLPSIGRIESLVTLETKRLCRELGEARLSKSFWKKSYTSLFRFP